MIDSRVLRRKKTTTFEWTWKDPSGWSRQVLYPNCSMLKRPNSPLIANVGSTKEALMYFRHRTFLTRPSAQRKCQGSVPKWALIDFPWQYRGWAYWGLNWMMQICINSGNSAWISRLIVQSVAAEWMTYNYGLLKISTSALRMSVISPLITLTIKPISTLFTTKCRSNIHLHRPAAGYRGRRN